MCRQGVVSDLMQLTFIFLQADMAAERVDLFTGVLSSGCWKNRVDFKLLSLSHREEVFRCSSEAVDRGDGACYEPCIIKKSNLSGKWMFVQMRRSRDSVW